jgi:hypothetical protein
MSCQVLLCLERTMIKIKGVKSNWFYSQRHLIQKYIQETYSVKTSWETLARKEYKYKFSDKEYSLEKCTIFENTENGLVFISDPHDHSNHGLYMRDILNIEKDIVHIVKSQFNESKYDIQEDFTPSCYFPRDLTSYLSFVDEVRNKRPDKKEDGLFFTGRKWKGRRKILRRLEDIIVSCDKLPPKEFVMKMNSHKVILSLPGHGNLCHREFEAFGVGVPVLMIKHKNTLYDPLIPDKHYISVNNYKDIKGRYEEVKDDEEYLEYVSQNAIEWFDNNCRYPNCYRSFDLPLKKILER